MHAIASQEIILLHIKTKVSPTDLEYFEVRGK